MIHVSSTVANGANYSVAPAVWKAIIPLKSRFDGDMNQIRSIQLRTLSGRSNSVGSIGATHDVSTNTTVVVPRNRPALMHQTTGSVQINGPIKFSSSPLTYGVGDQLAGVTDPTSVGSVTLMIKPTTTGLTISAGSVTATITITSGVYTITGTNFTAYLNGEQWYTSGIPTQTQRRFPFPRLLTIVFTTLQVSPVTVNGVATLGQVSVTPQTLSSTDVQTMAALVYRKPISSSILTDTAITNPFTDTLVTVPQTWNENLVS